MQGGNKERIIMSKERNEKQQGLKTRRHVHEWNKKKCNTDKEGPYVHP